uniref:ATP synthase subunit C n=1 Tax=Ndongobacter massiliensis TaxID=1871025 RepID=UPI0009307E6B|nr:ATP synthase subunit C [Ndongobacter massiliensis]
MTTILVLTAMIVLLTIASGIYLVYENTDPSKKRLKRALRLNLTAFVPALAMAIVLFIPGAVQAAGTGAADNGLAYVGVALATGLATIGTGYAVGSCGAAALGAVSEDPKILGKTLIFVGLAEGIAIYGLIISIMILGQLG